MWMSLCASFILGRREMELQLSKQVVNMLSGSSSLPGSHTHTHTHWHIDIKHARMALASVSLWDRKEDRDRMVSIRGQRQM